MECYRSIMLYRMLFLILCTIFLSINVSCGNKTTSNVNPKDSVSNDSIDLNQTQDTLLRSHSEQHARFVRVHGLYYMSADNRYEGEYDRYIYEIGDAERIYKTYNAKRANKIKQLFTKRYRYDNMESHRFGDFLFTIDFVDDSLVCHFINKQICKYVNDWTWYFQKKKCSEYQGDSIFNHRDCIRYYGNYCIRQVKNSKEELSPFLSRELFISKFWESNELITLYIYSFFDGDGAHSSYDRKMLTVSKTNGQQISFKSFVKPKYRERVKQMVVDKLNSTLRPCFTKDIFYNEDGKEAFSICKISDGYVFCFDYGLLDTSAGCIRAFIENKDVKKYMNY